MDQPAPGREVDAAAGPERDAASRRAALERFGRYAAAAPATTLLLLPEHAHATPKWLQRVLSREQLAGFHSLKPAEREALIRRYAHYQ